MARPASDAAQRIMALAVGKSCVINPSAKSVIRTARKFHPERTFAARTIDGNIVVLRTA